METYIVETEGEKLEIEIYPREQIERLKDRVRLGNQRLNEAWHVIRKLERGEHWKAELQRWHLANVKLSEYCKQLQQMGFADCLYKDESGKKTLGCLDELGCRVCPSSISYWEAELMALPGGGDK